MASLGCQISYSPQIFGKWQRHFTTFFSPGNQKVTRRGQFQSTYESRSTDRGRVKGKSETVREFNSYLDTLQSKLYAAHQALVRETRPSPQKRWKTSTPAPAERQECSFLSSKNTMTMSKPWFLRNFLPAPYNVMKPPFPTPKNFWNRNTTSATSTSVISIMSSLLTLISFFVPSIKVLTIQTSSTSRIQKNHSHLYRKRMAA